MAFDTAPPPKLGVPVPETRQASSRPQSQANPQIQISQASDPFNVSKSQPESHADPEAIDLLPKTSKAMNHGPTSQPSLMETPPSLAANDTVAGLPNLRTNGLPPAEPPMAPLRRSRTQASVSESQGGADLAKLRSAAGKLNSKEGPSESCESEEPKKSSLLPPRHSKRTISGNDASAKTQVHSNDYAALGQRRSVRLTKKAPLPHVAEGEPDHKKVKATGTRGRVPATSTVGRIVSGNRKPPEHPLPENAKHLRPQPASNISSATLAPPDTTANDVSIPQRSRSDPLQEADVTSNISHLLDLVRPLAQAYYELAKYNPQQVVAILSALPGYQRETPFVQILMGRAHLDLNSYAAAATSFARVRQLVPSQTQHMEVYSIALWHQKLDTELAFLSHELVESARLAPQSWCCLGNSFSLQRDHDNAIKCFRRASQLDPKAPYPWRLLGHEYFAAEDLEKASQSYRKAVAVDKRHYQGWYGLGRVYERHGRFDLAERHYRLAFDINPRSDVLACCIGTVQDKQGNNAAALSTYEDAVKLAPRNAIARFKLGRSMLRLRRYEEALNAFLTLKDQAPEEANVHFMLGRVYRMLGQKADAVRCLSNALGLDPKVSTDPSASTGESLVLTIVQAAPLIKDAMEALGEEDDEMIEAEDEDEDMG
ncbi:MAG: hypothetical protein Q9159_004655 [Coniocarpon cinnabarinum]